MTIEFIVVCFLPAIKVIAGDVIRITSNETMSKNISDGLKEIIRISINNITSPNKISGESLELKKSKDEPLSMDSLTIIWYITTFIALLGFFIVMACTENSCVQNHSRKPIEDSSKPPSPCPSYKNFAPPSYESVMSVMERNRNNQIFIVPVHEKKLFVDVGSKYNHSNANEMKK